MSMGGGGGRGAVKSDINVTPLVDVVLVLLIIFLVTMPILMKDISVDVPKKAEENTPPELLPDVQVVIVDFVRANLLHACDLLGDAINRSIFLVHGDATDLRFSDGAFDGYWTVQTLQHIPGFEQVVREAHRVLRPAGQFACYSLNRAKAVEIAYRLMGRSYHVRGKRPESFYLARGSVEEATIVGRVFGSPVKSRYTEVLFHPDLRLRTGRAASWIGTADAYLSSGMPLFAWIARQRSYHTRKLS